MGRYGQETSRRRCPFGRVFVSPSSPCTVTEAPPELPPKLSPAGFLSSISPISTEPATLQGGRLGLRRAGGLRSAGRLLSSSVPGVPSALPLTEPDHPLPGGCRGPRRNGSTHAAGSMRALHARYACNLASRWAKPLVRHHRLGSAHSVGACSACGRGPRPNPQHRRVRIPSGSLCVRVQHLRPELTGGTPTPPAPRCVAGRALSPDRPAMRNERPARIRTAGPTTCADPIPAAPPHTGHVGRCRVRR